MYANSGCHPAQVPQIIAMGALCFPTLRLTLLMQLDMLSASLAREISRATVSEHEDFSPYSNPDPRIGYTWWCLGCPKMWMPPCCTTQLTTNQSIDLKRQGAGPCAALCGWGCVGMGMGSRWHTQHGSPWLIPKGTPV